MVLLRLEGSGQEAWGERAEISTDEWNLLGVRESNILDATGSGKPH